MIRLRMQKVSRSNRLTLVDEFQRSIEAVLVPLISGHEQRICLLDLPEFPNVGDQLITLGELAFLEKAFPKASLRFFDHHIYSEKCDPLIEECSIILLHGGGNFGDIWPYQQMFRENILAKFSHKRIIQFPQSIRFSTQEQISRCSAVIAKAQDFHLMARDGISAAFAREHFDCPVHLIPDMAFFLPPVARLPPTRDVVCLFRSDEEAVADHAAIEAVVAQSVASHAVVDWNSESPSLIKTLDKLFAKFTRASPRLTWPIQRLMLSTRRRYALQRLKVGIALLSDGRVVVTDRLHAHILACLLGLPNFFFNSLDGKASALYRSWTHREPLAKLVESAEALRPLLVQAKA
jgi:pyruvyl transferase EpsO